MKKVLARCKRALQAQEHRAAAFIGFMENRARPAAAQAKTIANDVIKFLFDFIERAALCAAVYAAALYSGEKALAILTLLAFIGFMIWFGIVAQSAFFRATDYLTGPVRLPGWFRGALLIVVLSAGMVTGGKIANAAGMTLVGFLKQAESLSPKDSRYFKQPMSEALSQAGAKPAPPPKSTTAKPLPRYSPETNAIGVNENRISGQ